MRFSLWMAPIKQTAIIDTDVDWMLWCDSSHSSNFLVALLSSFTSALFSVTSFVSLCLFCHWFKCQHKNNVGKTLLCPVDPCDLHKPKNWISQSHFREHFHRCHCHHREKAAVFHRQFFWSNMHSWWLGYMPGKWGINLLTNWCQTNW